MELQGKVIAALPERSGVSSRGEWKTQEFVIETVDSQYPRKLVFTVFGADRLARFNIQIGQTVLVAFDIDAHEWNGRWFNDIRAYNVIRGQVQQPVAGAPQAAPFPPTGATAPFPPAQEPTGEGSADDLPF